MSNVKTGLLIIATGFIFTSGMIWLATPSGKWNFDPQVAEGSWQISVQIPPCDGSISTSQPERQGDVLTVYCKNMPIGEK